MRQESYFLSTDKEVQVFKIVSLTLMSFHITFIIENLAVEGHDTGIGIG